jgi:CheY-like chemotaxis protein
LVVDDEAVLRSVLALALPRWGFEVLQAANGPEAVEIYRRQAETIDLILMDVNMPGPSGPETFDEIRAFDPEVRCCFMTGCLGNYSGEELRERGALGVLDKPFDLADLGPWLLGKTRAA